MKLTSLIFFSFLLLGGFIKVNSLQCYVCEDCDAINTENLVTCKLGSGSGSGSGAGTGSGESGSGSGTGSGESGSGSGTGSGESGSGTGSGESGTGTGSGESGSGTGSGESGTGTGSGESGTGTGSGESASGESGSGTGTGSGESGTGTGSGESGSGTGSGESGTGSGESGSGTGSGESGTGSGESGSGTGSGESGTGSGESGTGTGSDDSGSGLSNQILLTRGKRHITRTKNYVNGCYCIGKENCECDDNVAQRADATAEDVVCYTVSYTDYNRTVVQQGCQFAQIANKTLCNFGQELANAANLTNFHCNTCNSDGCNNSSSIVKHSVYLIFVTIIAFLVK